mgnify:CR=1 FL=1
MKKKADKKSKLYSEDHVLVMFEEIRDQMFAFGEGQQVISNKVDNLEGKVDNLEGRFDNLEGRFDKLETKVDGIDARLIRVEDRLIKVEDRLIRVEDDVIEIKHKLSEKVDREEFNKMEKRMVKLEKLVFAKLH